MNITNFKTYVKYDFKRTDKDTEIVQALNDSMTAIAIKMPHSAYKYQSYKPTRVGIEDYQLPENIIHLRHPIRLIDGDDGWPLIHISKKEYDELEGNPNYASPSTGEPTHYCIYSNSVLLTPIPDSASYYLEMDWTRHHTAISGASEEPSMGSEWDEVLKQMSLFRLFSGVGQYDDAMFWRSLYEDNMGNPVGMYADLLRAEHDREDFSIRQVKANIL